MADASRLPAAARADAAALLVVLAVAAIAGWHSLGYGLWSHGEPGPGLFPLLVCALAAVFAVVALLAVLAGAAEREEADPDAAQQEGPILWGKLALYAAVMLAWPWLMVPLGFVLSTTVALFVVLRLAEGMGWAQVALVLAGAVGASWLVFDRLLGVPLPHGFVGIG